MTNGAPPDKDTREGLIDHLLYTGVPELIAKLRGCLDADAYSEHEVRVEALLVERDLERLSEMRDSEDELGA